MTSKAKAKAKSPRKKPPAKPALYSLTEEHRAQLKPWAEKWIANAMSCEQMTKSDEVAMVEAVRGLHAAASLPAPRAVVFVQSPFTAAIAAGIASGVWYLRENPGKHAALFGRKIGERELMAAIAPACAFAVSVARYQVAKLEAPPAPRRSATRAATDAATRAATDAATDDATDAATRAATDAATRAATDAATRAATDAATDDATDAATDAATYAATRAATDDATAAATRAATDAATGDATAAATDAATDAATAAATYAATRAATDAATDDATYAATDDATAAATDAATRAATDAATDLVRFLVRCSQYSWRLRNGGNQWSAWCSYLSFFRHVAKLPIDYSKWQHYESAAIHGGPRYMHQKFCIVSDRPAVCRKDEQNRPHCADGPSHLWRDGYALYFWRGTRVPAEWIERKESLDPATALNWPNIEQRRAAAEILGWGRILGALKPRTIDKDADPFIGELLEVDLPDSPGERFLKVKCGTGRDFVLPVHREARTALEANARTYRVDPSEYRQMEIRT